MRRAGILLVILGAWPIYSALAEEQAPVDAGVSSSQAVNGIFDGMVVGGTTRKTAGRNRARSHDGAAVRDSFAVNPSGGNTSGKDRRRNRIQTRSDMIPELEGTKAAPPQDGSATTPVQAVPATAVESSVANSISNTTQSAVQSSGQASPRYYKQLIDQVKGASDATPAGAGMPQKGKYHVTDKDRF